MEQHDCLKRNLFEWEHGDCFQIRDAVEGILCSGGLGSGKTSGFGNKIAKHYLLNGFGFLVLTAKQSELALWKAYCKKYGREKDLVVFSKDSGHAYNFFDEELSREDSGKGIAYNIASVLKDVIKSSNSDGQENDKAFWDKTLLSLLNNAVDLCLLTKNHKLEHVYQIIQSAPRNTQQLNNVKWRKSSKCFRLMEHTATHLEDLDDSHENIKLKRRLENIENFFLGTWLNLADKTKSIVETMVQSFLEKFMQDPLRDLFSNPTTIRPEDTLKGKIIVIDLPILVYDEIGRDAQILWKYLWQRAMQRRKITNKSRPVCLWVDEMHLFLNSDKDVQFQSIAREYRACSVYITQNLPNFCLNAGGGDVGKTRFKALAGNLGTKFFLANSDPETNEYASDLIGKDWQWTANQGKTLGEKISTNSGQSESLIHLVDPSCFTKLKTGGPNNNYRVEAFVHRQGKLFKSTNNNYILINLKQDTL